MEGQETATVVVVLVAGAALAAAGGAGVHTGADFAEQSERLACGAEHLEPRGPPARALTGNCSIPF